MTVGVLPSELSAENVCARLPRLLKNLTGGYDCPTRSLPPQRPVRATAPRRETRRAPSRVRPRRTVAQ